MDRRDSIFSHEERAIAALLRDDPGRSVEGIAEARDADPAVVEKSIDRIREKTDRAAATLAQSPHLDDALAGLTTEERERLRAAIEASD
jgi:DNA-binding MarR family transcriptional regulator